MSSSLTTAPEALQSHPKCKECHGVGVNLVVNPERLCAHCARKTKAFFDAATNKYCQEDGFHDISPMGNGLILKKILRDGEPNMTVEEGCPVFVQYIGRLENGEIFDTTRDIVDGKHVGGTDDDFEFQVGREKVIKGWDIGILTMNKGELSRFIIQPELAYGREGFAPKVEPGAVLDFEIELIRFKDPLPRFPSPKELAESKREREKEEREMMEKNPPPTIDERIVSATEKKEAGNKLMAEKKYEEAKKEYDSGFIYIFVSKEEWDGLLTEEERTKINAMKLPLYLNRGLAKLKLKMLDEAEWDCQQAVELDPENVKGNYRISVVYMEKLEAELEKERQKEFWIIEKAFELADKAEKCLEAAKRYSKDPEDKQILSAFKRLERDRTVLTAYNKKYKQQQKKLYRDNMIAKLETKNKLQQQKLRQKELEQEFADMPPLE